MELYHLRSFVAVAHEGHLTRAAQRLFISQPALSAHIKALEEELGVALFTRRPHGMQLTPAGEVLMAQAEKSLNDIHELFQQAKNLQHELTGTAKFGLNTHPELLKIPEFFSVMQEHYPKLAFHLLQRPSWLVPEALRTRQLDVGYVYGLLPTPEFAVIPVQIWDVCIVGPAKWQAELAQANWEDIARLPWVWIEERSAFCQVLACAFEQRHLTVVKTVVVDEEETLKTLVMSGAGLSLMLAAEAEVAAQRGEVAIWPHDTLQVDLAFAYLQERQSEVMIQSILNGIFIVWDLPHGGPQHD
jgi:DNA-binding transcriptional LysR family regulator